MSLIQEALKRQQAEYGGNETPPPGGGGGAGGGAQPQPPPPMAPVNPHPPEEDTLPPPVPDKNDKPAGTARPWLSVLGVVLVASLILAGAGGLILLAMRHLASGATSQTQPNPVAGSAPARRTKLVDTAAPGRAKEVAAAVARRAAETELKDPPPEVAPPPPAPPEPEAPAVVTVAELPPPLPPPSEIETAPLREQPQTKSTPPAPPPLRWPNLKLTGVLSSSLPGEGAARINDSMVFVGNQVEGVTLVRIHEEGVVLRYGEETKFLRVGAILY